MIYSVCIKSYSVNYIYYGYIFNNAFFAMSLFCGVSVCVN